MVSVGKLRCGVAFLNGFGVWALHFQEDGGYRLRLSLDDPFAVGIHEYQRVELRLPGDGGEQLLYFRSRLERPPFVWVELAKDVRRVGGGMAAP